jgi:hypothetical protein
MFDDYTLFVTGIYSFQVVSIVSIILLICLCVYLNKKLNSAEEKLEDYEHRFTKFNVLSNNYMYLVFILFNILKNYKNNLVKRKTSLKLDSFNIPFEKLYFTFIRDGTMITMDCFDDEEKFKKYISNNKVTDKIYINKNLIEIKNFVEEVNHIGIRLNTNN